MRSEEEILARVRERAGHLRRRRRLWVGAAGSVGVSAIVGLLIALIAPIGHTDGHVVTDGSIAGVPQPGPVTSSPGGKQSEPSVPAHVPGPESSNEAVAAGPGTVPGSAASSVPACDADLLYLTAALPSQTYQPGDQIPVTVRLVNPSETTCAVPTGHSEGCSPTAVLHHFHDGDADEPGYDERSATFARSACPASELVPAHGELATTIDATFVIGDSAPYYRAGYWDIYVNWPSLPDAAGVITSFRCPEPGCRSAAPSQTPSDANATTNGTPDS